MSDESPPPPLRLKPRFKPETEIETAAPESSPTPDKTGAPAAQSELPRIKLRPKLNPPAAPSSPPDQPALAVVPLSPETPAAPTAVPVEPPKFKLKDNTAAPISAPPSATPLPPPPSVPASATAPVSGTTPPIFPVVARAPSASPASLPPPIPKQTRPAPTRAPARARSSSSKLVLLAAAVALLAAAYFGYEKFIASPAASEVAEAPKRPVTPSKTLNEIAAAPAKAIQKAESVVATVNARENASRNEVQASEETPGKSAANAAPPATDKPAAAVTSTTQLAPGLSMTTTANGVAGDASPSFRSWVVQARISGVFQGTPARILINGRMVTSGELVDESLAITFDRIDAATSNLIFRDRTGATVARRF